VHPQAPGHWRVDGDGVLTGSGPVSYLFSDRSDFADFHLRAECRINAGGDSGVFFRCEYGLNQERFGAWVEPRGYEAGINHGNPGYLTGNLYGPDSNRPILQKVAEDVTEADRWFTLEVVAQGNRIKVMVDKKILVDYVDLDRLYTRGHIALQGGPGRRTVVQFRKIEIKELPAEKDAAPDYALEFDGKTSHVLVEGLGRDAAGPFTLEAYVTPARLLSNPEGPQVIMGVGGPFSVAFSQYGARWRMHEGGPDGGFWLYAKPDTAEVGKRVHVAAVYDGKQRRFYVNGRASFATEVAAGKIQPQAVTVLGRTIGDMGGHFQGVIDEVRISKVARYDKDFTPDKRFEPDKDTLALYHCDEGRGEVLKDSSGNGHHGKIVGAKWANADGTPIKPAAPEPPGAQALRDLVAAKERTRDTVKLRVEAGKDSPLDLVAAEVELVEARIRLAQAEADKAGVVSLLEKLVAQRQEQRRLTQIRVEEGIDAPALLDDTDARVADAKARLEKARAEVPPGATPAPRSKE
jgi:hypothetical protein